ncbi:MAG: hypothetical protein QM763_21475 [Agriterribacter sp.]
MKNVLATLLMFITVSSFSQSKQGLKSNDQEKSFDLSTEINQTAFDKIIQSAEFPLTLFEHNDPFQSQLSEVYAEFSPENKQNEKVYDYKSLASLIEWSVNGQKNSFSTSLNDEVKEQVNQAWLASIDEVLSVKANYEKAVKNKTVVGYTGPAPEDFAGGGISLPQLEKWDGKSVSQIFNDLSGFGTSSLSFAKAHLSYAKVQLTDRPTLLINSPSFSIKDINVQLTARGELWAKLPQFRCCKKVLGICVWVCFDGWKWTKLASITVSPVIGSDITVGFNIENLKISAKGQFDRLYLNVPILRDINLAGIANKYMKNRSFEVYDVSKFVASIPYINTNFRITEVVLPNKQSGIQVKINFSKQ